MHTTCVQCDRLVVATEDDELPMCEEHQGEWAEVQAVRSIMAGEYEHLNEELMERIEAGMPASEDDEEDD